MHTHPDPKSSSFPHFQPHITLASINPSSTPGLTAALSSIPPNQPSIPVFFQSLQVGDHFFRSVYIAIRPSTALSDLHAAIHAALGTEPNTPLFPHMSVYYIHDNEAGERKRIYEELERAGRMKQDNDSLTLDCWTDGMVHEWINGFEGEEIWIVDCDGPVEDWKKVLRKIPLERSQSVG